MQGDAQAGLRRSIDEKRHVHVEWSSGGRNREQTEGALLEQGQRFLGIDFEHGVQIHEQASP